MYLQLQENMKLTPEKSTNLSLGFGARPIKKT
jgi:hypothetical protein